MSDYPNIGWCPVCNAPRIEVGTGCEMCFNHLLRIDSPDTVESLRQRVFEMQNAAINLTKQLAACEKERDELLAALTGLHKVCEIALQGKDGQQHTYFETRKGHFVEATGAMRIAEALIQSHGIPVKTYAGGEAHYVMGEPK